jgi:hypothetical protein
MSLFKISNYQLIKVFMMGLETSMVNGLFSRIGLNAPYHAEEENRSYKEYVNLLKLRKENHVPKALK